MVDYTCIKWVCIKGGICKGSLQLLTILDLRLFCLKRLDAVSQYNELTRQLSLVKDRPLVVFTSSFLTFVFICLCFRLCSKQSGTAVCGDRTGRD